MNRSNHFHYKTGLIKAQFEYIKRPIALVAAKAIVKAKIRNCEFLLTNYRQSRQRSGSSQTRSLDNVQRKLAQVRSLINTAVDRNALFRLEAAAAKAYWSVFSILCRQEKNWKRILYLEALNLKRAILESAPWLPTAIPWGHGWRCPRKNKKAD